ncbi:MAG: hypothetical protein HYU66_03870, partial [Armatimonadetes bacterium]|nr:hypothetical protein [Armatimonadota bacterium]
APPAPVGEAPAEPQGPPSFEEPPQPADGKLELAATIVSGQPTAVVRVAGKYTRVAVGERLEGYEVSAVRAGRVYLKRDGATYQLRLAAPKPPPRRGAPAPVETPRPDARPAEANPVPGPTPGAAPFGPMTRPRLGPRGFRRPASPESQDPS